MGKVNFNVSERADFTLVEFTLDGPISPDILHTLTPPQVDATKGVVISGRGPIWLYAYLTHYYHYTLWVATYDPRLGGAVVVQSHTPSKREGDVIPV